jgi:hypothetical protein
MGVWVKGVWVKRVGVKGLWVKGVKISLYELKYELIFVIYVDKCIYQLLSQSIHSGLQCESTLNTISMGVWVKGLGGMG